MPGLYHCEDGAVVPQLLVKAKKIAVTTDALYNYFIRNASLSTAFKPDAYLGFWKRTTWYMINWQKSTMRSASS